MKFHKVFITIFIGILFYVFLGVIIYNQRTTIYNQKKNYIKYRNIISDLEYQNKKLEYQNDKLVNHIEISNNRIVILSVRSNKEEKAR